jgi:hypothetical protein
MAEDFDNHRRIFDRGDDLQGAAAIRAVLHVDVEDPFEQPGPAHARGVSLGRGVIGRGRGGTLCRNGRTTKLYDRRNEQIELEDISGYGYNPDLACRRS